MQEIMTFAAEARGAVGHDAFSLGSANFAAKVGLAGCAEFAFAAFGGAEKKKIKLSLKFQMDEEGGEGGGSY